MYYFLAVVLVVYFVVPARAKNWVLLAASLLFYFWGEQLYTLLMVANVLLAYIFGLLIDRLRGTGWARLCLALSIIVSLGTLSLFKYSDFFIQTVNGLAGSNWALLGLALPIGISFYTFQTMSYTIDVYRGDAAVQKSFIRLATYVMLFPQLIAGPIVRYTTVEQELAGRRHTLEDFAAGSWRFALGLGKKVLIANQLGELCDIFRASSDVSVAFYWLYALAFSLHIYFDFSGYSDMAIGLGRIFGFHFMENFNYPFIARTATEFWRRWHISLGSWFRDYLYIPLGGNRVPAVRWVVNIFIVWFLTGLWHGASWNFVLWGLFFGVLLVAEKLFLGRLLAKVPLLAHAYLIVAVLISFVIFNAADMATVAADLAAMFGLSGLPIWSATTAYYCQSYALLLVIGIVGATPLIKSLATRLADSKIAIVAQPVLLAALLLVCTAYLVDGSFNPFLYFRF